MVIGERRNYSDSELLYLQSWHGREIGKARVSAVYFCAVLTIAKTNMHHHNISKGGARVTSFSMVGILRGQGVKYSVGHKRGVRRVIQTEFT